MSPSSDHGRKVFDAAYAPRDEIDGVLEALRAEGFDVFEIPNNLLWGGGAVCVKNTQDAATAREVVLKFQEQWRESASTASTPTKIRWVLAIPVIAILLLFILTTLLSLA